MNNWEVTRNAAWSKAASPRLFPCKFRKLCRENGPRQRTFPCPAYAGAYTPKGRRESPDLGQELVVKAIDFYLVVLQPLRFISWVQAVLTAKLTEISVNVGAFFAVPAKSHIIVGTQFSCRLCNLEALASIGIHSLGIGFDRLLGAARSSFFLLGNTWTPIHVKVVNKTAQHQNGTVLPYLNLQTLENLRVCLQLGARQMKG